jgi:hypothetical protein
MQQADVAPITMYDELVYMTFRAMELLYHDQFNSIRNSTASRESLTPITPFPSNPVASPAMIEENEPKQTADLELQSFSPKTRRIATESSSKSVSPQILRKDVAKGLSIDEFMLSLENDLRKPTFLESGFFQAMKTDLCKTF